MKIEFTEEIIKIIEDCPKDTYECENHCPLFGACLQWYTGDDSENK